MTDLFWNKKTLYPLFSVASSFCILITSLTAAKSFYGAFFLILVFFLFLCFGYIKACLSVLPFTFLYVGIFSAIFYFASSGDLDFVLSMAVRFTGVSFALIPCLALPPVYLVRNLRKLKCPRLITLGMLITLSFIPVLSAEIRQVKNAMKTRGAVSFWRPKVLYRAFLIPLIVRLVNISDTLTLSVETRGFTSDDAEPTLYKDVVITKRDIVFATLFLLFLTATFVFCLFSPAEISGSKL